MPGRAVGTIPRIAERQGNRCRSRLTHGAAAEKEAATTRIWVVSEPYRRCPLIPRLLAVLGNRGLTRRPGASPTAASRGTVMHLTNEGLLVILFVGLVSGYLAGKIVQGTGLGIVGGLVAGVVGAFIGDWLLPQLNIHLGTGIVSAIVNATFGAILLLVIIRLIRGGGRWHTGPFSGWGRRL